MRQKNIKPTRKEISKTFGTQKEIAFLSCVPFYQKRKQGCLFSFGKECNVSLISKGGQEL